MSAVTRNPLSSPSDNAEWEIIHAVLDVAITLRGEEPNMSLGYADMFLAVGEWKLAFEAMEAVIDERNGAVNSWVQEALDRARALLQD